MRSYECPGYIFTLQGRALLCTGVRHNHDSRYSTPSCRLGLTRWALAFCLFLVSRHCACHTHRMARKRCRSDIDRHATLQFADRHAGKKSIAQCLKYRQFATGTGYLQPSRMVLGTARLGLPEPYSSSSWTPPRRLSFPSGVDSPGKR